MDGGMPVTAQQMTDSRCEAIFASALQPSDALSADLVSTEIDSIVSLLGAAGCASKMAQEFGDHPETACQRMRWALHLISELFPAPSPQPEAAPVPAA